MKHDDSDVSSVVPRTRVFRADGQFSTFKYVRSYLHTVILTLCRVFKLFCIPYSHSALRFLTISESTSCSSSDTTSIHSGNSFLTPRYTVVEVRIFATHWVIDKLHGDYQGNVEVWADRGGHLGRSTCRKDSNSKPGLSSGPCEWDNRKLMSFLALRGGFLRGGFLRGGFLRGGFLRGIWSNYGW